jgi:hypothetical protein
MTHKVARSIPSLVKLANRAIKIAVRKALLEHKEKGVPIAVWQHNKVVCIPSRRIPVR